jgi:hypothetical protein
MDELSAYLRGAVGEPPPATINLDRLIAAEQRRSMMRAWAGAGAAVAVAVAVIVALPFLFTGPTPGGVASPGGTLPALVDTPGPPMPCTPTATPSPSGGPPRPLPETVRARPTEPADKAMPRLTAALLPALRASLPANVSVENPLPGCPLPEFESQPGGMYLLGLHLVRGENFGTLAVFVGPTVADRVGCTATNDLARPSAAGPEPTLPQTEWPPEECERVDLRDGTVVTTRTRTEPVAQIATEVTRPDGTHVMFVDNYWRSQQPRPALERLLTAEQVITIGKDPRLTLYP